MPSPTNQSEPATSESVCCCRVARALRLPALFLLLAALFLFAGALRQDQARRETAVYEAVCTQLLANTTEGRQALVSSLWWPPLPFLVRLPFAASFNLPESPLASIATSAIFAAATVFLAWRVLRRWLSGRTAFLLTAALALSPPFLHAATDGSVTSLLMYLMLLAVYGIVEWLRVREVRFLVYAAAGSALLSIAAAEAIPWVLLLLAVLIADTLSRPTAPGQKQAVLFLALLPPLYTGGFWLLMNWLIMGDPLYPLRPLAFAALLTGPAGDSLPLFDELPGVLALASGIPLFVLALARRERAGLALAALVILPFLAAGVAHRSGFGWTVGEIPAATLPISFLTIAYLAGKTRLPEPPLPRWLLAIPIIAVAANWLSLAAFPIPADRRTTFAASISDRQRWLPLIEQRVRAQTDYPKIFVCGYDSFELLGPHPDPVFVPALDFNFHEAERNYYGQQLYVLVHRPENRSAMESTTWKYDRLYNLGGEGTLYDSDWGPWRLFAVVQAPP